MRRKRNSELYFVRVTPRETFGISIRIICRLLPFPPWENETTRLIIRTVHKEQRADSRERDSREKSKIMGEKEE